MAEQAQERAQERALAEQDRQRAIAAQRYYYGPPPAQQQPEPAPWGYYRPYYPR
jgi:hypothetical protein